MEVLMQFGHTPKNRKGNDNIAPKTTKPILFYNILYIQRSKLGIVSRKGLHTQLAII